MNFLLRGERKRIWPSFSGLGGVVQTAGSRQRGPRCAADDSRDVVPDFELQVRGCSPWLRPEDHEHVLDGLRKAGWQG
jgi:hypothetical protein